MEIRCDTYGHSATFYTDKAAPSDAALVEWGRREIAVPSGSVLDCCALVRLRDVDATTEGARKWCARVGATFVQVDRGTVAFQVTGFSRYRYVDSDSEEEEEYSPSPQRKVHSSAGRTPYRRVPNLSDDDEEENEEPNIGNLPSSVINVDGEDAVFTRPGVSAPINVDEETVADDTTSNVTSLRTEEPRITDLVPRSQVPPSVAAAEFWSRKSPGPKGLRMRKALFIEPSKPADAITNASNFGNNELMRDATFTKADSRHVRFIENDNKLSPIREQQSDDEDMMDVTGTTPSKFLAAEQNAVRLSTFGESIPFPIIEKSIIAGHEKIYHPDDMAVALGRSFRLGVAPNGYYQPMYMEFAGGNRFVVAFSSYGALEQQDRNYYNGMMRTHLTAWKNREMEVSMDTDDSLQPQAPQRMADEGDGSQSRRLKVPTLKKAFEHPEVANGFLDEVVDDFTRAVADPHAQHGVVLFGLLRALFYHNEGTSAVRSENLLSRLAEWARGPAGTRFDESIPQEPSLRRALLLMSIGDIEGAADAAIDVGHFRLGLMIARGMEAPRDELREDAEAQLMQYCLEGVEMDEIRKVQRDELEPTKSILDGNDNEQVSMDEAMILLLLAGRVTPVARKLNLSWYRVFIMELLHGAGCSDMSLPERVSAAVEGIDHSRLPTTAPHKKTKDLDAAYHLLKLYSHPTGSYPITSGVYSSRSVGFVHSALDARLPWLLHQILSSLVGPASNSKVAWHLAEAFSLQLFAAGLPLWGFYVMCSGSAPEATLKAALIQKWPELSRDFVEWNVGGESTICSDHSTEGKVEVERTHAPTDTMGAEAFLVSVLGTPVEWIHEAKAIYHHYNGELMEECKEWIRTKTPDGCNKAHDILSKQLFPRALSLYKTEEQVEIRKHLYALSVSNTNISNWAAQGQLILQYLTYVADIPDTRKADVAVLRSMAQRVVVMAKHAESPLQKHAIETMADGILAAERALDVIATDENGLLGLLEDLEVVPVSKSTKMRLIGELRHSEEVGASISSRYAAAHPVYYRFLADELTE